MRIRPPHKCARAAGFVLVCFGVTLAEDYTIDRYMVSGGGGTAEGDEFTLRSTIG